MMKDRRDTYQQYIWHMYHIVGLHIGPPLG